MSEKPSGRLPDGCLIAFGLFLVAIGLLVAVVKFMAWWRIAFG